MEKKTIGKFIAELRKQSGMTQKDLSDKLFVSDKTISRWERDECTPDLNLIPTIADIFNVSTDELLRGERIPAPSVSENLSDHQSDFLTVQKENIPIKGSSEKQIKRLLDGRFVKFKNFSLLSVGIFILGLFAALICNFVFYRANLGFCLASLFTVAAIICQICFTNSAFFRADEDDGDMQNIASAYNSDIVKTTVKVLLCIVSAFGLPIPFVLVPAYTGLNFDSWLFYGCIFAITLFLLFYLIYKMWIENSLIKKGLIILNDKEKAKNARRKHVLKTCGIPCACVMAALLLGVFVVTEVLNVYHFFRPTVFDNYEDFQAYMEQEVKSDFWVDSDVTVIYPDGEKYPETENTPKTYYLLNADDEVLCEYVWNNKDVYRVDANYEKEDGLPIKVYSYEERYNAYDTQTTIAGILTAAIAVDCIVFLILYAVKMRKY